MKNKWHIVTIGHLTRNIYWGEDNRRVLHPCIATCTVVESEYGNILIDPSLPGEALAKELYDQTGIKAEDIAYTYSTHCHLDHWTGTEAFKNAKLCMPAKELAYLKEDRALYDGVRGKEIDRMIGISGQLVPGFQLVPLPGHSLGLHGLLFEGPEGRILATGDACMGYEYFHAKRGYFWSAEYTLSCESIEKAAAAADIIIPGHGNYFNVKAYLYDPDTENEPMPAAKPGIISEYSRLREIIYDRKKLAVLLSYLPNFNEAALRIARDVPLHALILNMPADSQEKKEELLSALNQ